MSLVAIGPLVLVVHPSAPARNVGELIALARSRPGKVNYGTNGLTPAGVPQDIIAQLNAVIGKVVNTTEMKEAFSHQGLEPQTGEPEQFAALIRGEIAQNTRLIELAGVIPE